MADSYTKWVMTSKFAEAMQSASQSGNKIEWVRVVSSDDTHAFSDLPGFDKTTLDTARARQTALVNSVTVKGNTVTLTALFTNYKNEIDYYIRTLFLVAKYNGAEFLAGASIANTSDSAFRMPAASVTEITEFTTRPQISVTSTGVISTTVDPVTAATNERVNGVETTLQTQIDAINEDKVSLRAEFAKYVTKGISETISGVKTFTETIVGSITGNAGTATKLKTARKINGVVFDGTKDIELKADTDRPKLAPKTNLNNIKSEGHYHCIDNVTADTLLNNPFKTTYRAFYMDVMYQDGYARQQVWHYDVPDLSYARTYITTKQAWTPWVQVK